MRLPKEFVEQVRHQTDIVQIVSDYVTIKKRGATYLALCPFHQEKTPSLNVHPGKQFFKCFGCGCGGDVFAFVMQIEGCGFPEAVRLVADKSGIPIPRLQAPTAELLEEEQKQRQWRDRLLQINALAQRFFQHQLTAAGGRGALEYLSQRGLEGGTLAQFGVGYAPPSWDALSTFLRRQRIPQDQIARSGLVVLRSDGQGSYDRFRGRIIFPIADAQGRIIAFGGRSLEETSRPAGPKYLNSPETVVYTKGRHLFGLNQAKEAIRRAGYAILVEGYFDVLVPFQAGVRNVVASLGTALTDRQISLLRRFTGKIVVNFDPDLAGRAAAMRSLQMLVQRGFDVHVLILPAGEDPDSFIRRFGVDEYQRWISQAHSYLDFVMAQATQAVNVNEPAGRAQALREILPYLATIPDRIERSASGDRVAGWLMLDPRLVQDELRRHVRARQQSGRGHPASSQGRTEIGVGPARGSSRQAQVTPAEKLLLEILLNCPEVARRLSDELKAKAGAFRQAITWPLFEEILARLGRAEPLEYPTLAQAVQERQDLLDVLQRALMAEPQRDAETLYQEARGCLTSLEYRRLEHELRQVQRDIELALQRQDAQLSDQLLMRKRELSTALAQNTYQTDG